MVLLLFFWKAGYDIRLIMKVDILLHKETN